MLFYQTRDQIYVSVSSTSNVQFFSVSCERSGGVLQQAVANRRFVYYASPFADLFIDKHAVLAIPLGNGGVTRTVTWLHDVTLQSRSR